MSNSISTDDLVRLPVLQRLELIEAVWDSLEVDAADIPLAEWQREVIDKRIDSLEKGASICAEWDEVMARIVAKP